MLPHHELHGTVLLWMEMTRTWFSQCFCGLWFLGLHQALWAA